MIDRYVGLADEILALTQSWGADKDADDRHIEILHLLKTRARVAILRSICDREGHRPDVLIRAKHWNGELALMRVACSFCGVELREVEE